MKFHKTQGSNEKRSGNANDVLVGAAIIKSLYGGVLLRERSVADRF